MIVIDSVTLAETLSVKGTLHFQEAGSTEVTEQNGSRPRGFNSGLS